jgi:hypothetical protein
MRGIIFSTTVLAVALFAGGALGDNKPPAPPPKPPSPYPMSADAFRTRMDKLTDNLRAQCAKQPKCPHDFVESGLTQMKLRTFEACRDGIVTLQEATWVVRARPTIPRPSDPSPDDQQPDEP